MGSTSVLRDSCIEWREFLDFHSQNYSGHWMFRCPAISCPTSAWVSPLTRGSLPPVEAHSDYWRVFPSLEWKSISSFYQLVLSHGQGQDRVKDCLDSPCHVWNFSQGAQWTRPDCEWENGHVRAVDNSHWGHMEETRVPYHGSALCVLEDRYHFPPPRFLFSRLLFFSHDVVWTVFIWFLSIGCGLYSS